MIFGKIAYLNLLPFHMFLKRYLRHSGEKKGWQMRGRVPAKVNRDFELGRVDAAVISSIKSRGRRCADMGIVAEGEVLSVLLYPGEHREDGASETSNALARILGLQGRVVIGDRALRERLSGEGEAIDLAEAWRRRYGLPFVFARLCARPRHYRRIERMARLFLRRPVRIPWRERRLAARRHGISEQALDDYLARIGYAIGWREKRALKQFFTELRKTN